ncbi:uncharacterized protein LOC119163145 isoform X2 [Rhipicephalus microplus]|uniref:uncharacterized protein LOC119163145 isoform X2 n=1 Tax=Rhipicephalus microplus TaxID=6941 RepID=UPI003F6B7DE2
MWRPFQLASLEMPRWAKKAVGEASQRVDQNYLTRPERWLETTERSGIARAKASKRKRRLAALPLGGRCSLYPTAMTHAHVLRLP